MYLSAVFHVKCRNEDKKTWSRKMAPRFNAHIRNDSSKFILILSRFFTKKFAFSIVTLLQLHCSADFPN